MNIRKTDIPVHFSHRYIRFTHRYIRFSAIIVFGENCPQYCIVISNPNFNQIK